MSRVFKALSDTTRREVLLLRAGPKMAMLMAGMAVAISRGGWCLRRGAEGRSAGAA